MSKREKMKSLNVGNVTWFFFNVHGLQINKSKIWRNFLFGDATLANPEEVKQYLKEINTRDEYIKSFGNPHSYLIVQVGGYFKHDEENIKADARRRADEIISLIYFVFLYLTDYQWGITMDYELFSSTGGRYILLNGLNNYSVIEDNTKGEYSVLAPENPYTFSRSRLLQILKKYLFTDLTNIIINEKNNLHKKVSDSLIVFYKTTNTPSALMQFIGAVTSMEVILKDEKPYKQITNRIHILLDDEFHNSFIDKSGDNIGVFELRHNIIHEGKFCNRNDAWRAIRLASCCVIAFAFICKHFSSKEEICSCLDILYKYSKNDKHYYSKDTFKLINKWESIKFDTSILDWIILHLISYYGANNSEIKPDANMDIAKIVFTYHKFRNISLESAYHLIRRFIVYDRSIFTNFKVFDDFHKANIKSIENGFNLFNKYNKLEGASY